jgi:outer membrane protein assembly factor BamB
VNERGNVLYAAGQSGVIYALSTADGRLVWKHKFSNCLVNTVQPVGEKLVLASSMDGKLLCIEQGL